MSSTLKVPLHVVAVGSNTVFPLARPSCITPFHPPPPPLFPPSHSLHLVLMERRYDQMISTYNHFRDLTGKSPPVRNVKERYIHSKTTYIKPTKREIVSTKAVHTKHATTFHTRAYHSLFNCSIQWTNSNNRNRALLNGNNLAFSYSSMGRTSATQNENAEGSVGIAPYVLESRWTTQGAVPCCKR
jgi:hypothetical protein